MKLEFIEAGQIVNTHGVRGEMKLNPWDVDVELLRECKTFYIDGKPVQPLAARIHKNCLLFRLSGVDDMNAALTYKGKVVSLRRDELDVEDGFFFPDELIGVEVLDAANDRPLGKIAEVIAYPGHDVYVVKGETEFMVPAVPAFIEQIDENATVMKIHVWEGLI